jgi:hypothetical protein
VEEAMSANSYEPGEGIRTFEVGRSIMTSKADGTTAGDALVVVEGRRPAG